MQPADAHQVELGAAHQADELMRQATRLSNGWLDAAQRLDAYFGERDRRFR